MENTLPVRTTVSAKTFIGSIGIVLSQMCRHQSASQASAYYVRWRLERAWAPLLFQDEAKPTSADVVAPARRSAAALAKTST